MSQCESFINLYLRVSAFLLISVCVSPQSGAVTQYEGRGECIPARLRPDLSGTLRAPGGNEGKMRCSRVILCLYISVKRQMLFNKARDLSQVACTRQTNNCSMFTWSYYSQPGQWRGRSQQEVQCPLLWHCWAAPLSGADTTIDQGPVQLFLVSQLAAVQINTGVFNATRMNATAEYPAQKECQYSSRNAV